MMPTEEIERRKRELGTRAVELVMQMQCHPEDWWGAVYGLRALGFAADDLVTDYYDEMTTEEVLAEFAGAEETTLLPSPKGVTIGFTSSFTGPELAELKRWGGEAGAGQVIHDAALAYIRRAEGIRVVLAKAIGREPTRAEVLTGLALRDDV